MKKNNILWGLILILLALSIILKELKIIFIDIYDLKIIAALLIGYLAFKSLLKKNFFAAFFYLGFIIYLNPQNIFPNISLFKILFVAILLGIGFNLLFSPTIKKRVFIFNDSRSGKRKEYYSENSEYYSENNDKVSFETIFSQATRYVYSDDLTDLELSTVFGSLKIYLDQATINPAAKIEIENIFAKTEIYVPKDYYIKTNATTVFGNINEINPPTSYTKTITLTGDIVCGSLTIVYL